MNGRRIGKEGRIGKMSRKGRGGGSTKETNPKEMEKASRKAESPTICV